jgi:hypothetical protein
VQSATCKHQRSLDTTNTKTGNSAAESTVCLLASNCNRCIRYTNVWVRWKMRKPRLLTCRRCSCTAHTRRCQHNAYQCSAAGDSPTGGNDQHSCPPPTHTRIASPTTHNMSHRWRVQTRGDDPDHAAGSRIIWPQNSLLLIAGSGSEVWCLYVYTADDIKTAPPWNARTPTSGTPLQVGPTHSCLDRCGSCLSIPGRTDEPRRSTAVQLQLPQL